MARKIFSLLISFSLIFQQIGFASIATELNIAGYISKMSAGFVPDRFRPVHIRFFSYDAQKDSIKVMLDKGDAKDLKESQINESSRELLKYFLVGVSLPNNAFWVNLRPDSEDSVIDQWLSKTDVGRIMLEADLQLKKDTAQFTSPETSEGREYWDKLYKKAQELYGYQEVTIPTLTRPWIVPNEIIVRESNESAYIYKATLKVMLEQDYIKDSAVYSFKDARAKALNEYSSQLIRELIIPKLTKEVNLSKRYAGLRQVYYSIILSRWFKARFNGQPGKYAGLIDKKDLTGLTSKAGWQVSTFFNAYKESFAKGEYNIKETVHTPTGQVIRSYFSGGEDLTAMRFNGPAFKAGNPLMGRALLTAGLVTPEGAVSSPLSAATSFIYNEDPAERVEQIQYLLGEIDKELAAPGTSNMPYIALIGDYHGAVDRFAQLMSKILNVQIGFEGQLLSDVSIESQLKKQGLSLKGLKGPIYFHGDILDRGENGIQCFFGIREFLEKAPGKAFYISGNHDFWAFSNLLGIHLPWYKDFHFYGDTAAENLIAKQRKSHPEYFDSQKGFLWWTERLAEYNADQEKFQKEFLSGQAKQLREKFIEYYSRYSKQWNTEQLDAMENLIGHFKRIDVPDPFVGLNGLGKTSPSWWKALSKQLSAGLEARQGQAEKEELAIWREAVSLAGEIATEVYQRSKQAASEGKWWYSIFESINNKAYETLEWWAKDWSSHDKWGTAVIKELNAMLENPKFTHPLIVQDRLEFNYTFDRETGKFKGEKVTQANYIRSNVLKSLASFYRQNFNLHLRSPYEDLAAHSWYPVQDNAEIVISYNGNEYSGLQLYKGLKAISDNVKDSTKTLSEIWEALNLVNAWYADKTTTVKPRDEKRYREIGIAKINSGIGVLNMFTGHNPVNKSKVPFMVQDGDYAHFHLDKGMAPKFGGEGAFVLIGPQGVHMYGFEDKFSNKIIEAPFTVIAGKEGAAPTIIENNGMPAKEFLAKTKAGLEEELKGLKAASSAVTAESLNTPHLNFADTSAVNRALKGVVEVTPGGVKVLDESALRDELIYKLVYDATFNGNPEIVSLTRKLIKDTAASLGIKPLSVYDHYLKKAKDSRHYTIPAINIRGMAYDTARAVFQSAVSNNVADPFILEIAKSEIGYTGQRPAEYTTSMLAAAIKEGYNKPVYLQGDHFQLALKDYQKDSVAAIESLRKLIREAIEAGFYQIDLDMSTLVDWSKPTVQEQQKLNYEMTAELTAYVRVLERELGLDKQGIVVNLGGEIGEIGMGLDKANQQNSTVEDLKAFMNGYNAELARLGKEAGFKLDPITKIAVQSGTKHGGVRDATGKLARAKVGFNTLGELGKVAREEFGLAGVVQHGASTLPEPYFVIFAGNSVPEGTQIDETLLNAQGKADLNEHPVAEVHLATAYQDTTLDHPEFPAELGTQMRDFILEKYPVKEGQDPNKVFVDNRKNAWGPYKLHVWNLPESVKTSIIASLKTQFDTVFNNMGMAASSGMKELKPIVGANWKMVSDKIVTEEDAVRLLKETAAEIRLRGISGVETIVAPTDLHISAVSKALKVMVETGAIPEGAIQIAAQNISSVESGAQTGRTSVVNLKEYYGVKYVIIGHSEQRRDKAGNIRETNETVNQKVKLALKNGFKVILCVGETLSEKDSGKTKEVVGEQVRESLVGIQGEDAMKSVTLAYEPVWAIGTGKNASPQEAQEVHSFIRNDVLAGHDMYGKSVADNIRIQYGGSVNSENIANYMAQPDINGVLVGGASLKADSFGGILKGSADSVAVRASASSAIDSKKGGIDFRPPAMVINYQAMGNFASLNPKLPVLSKVDLAAFDIDKELSGIERLVEDRMVPSGERIKEVLAACSQKGELGANKERLMALLVKVGILEETQCCLQEASNEYKEALVLADSLV